jgi:uncharacterized protein YxjI
MNECLAGNVYLVKEHVGAFKAANNFDIYDPETGDMVMLCREDRLGFFTKILRFTEYKRYTPFDIRISTPDGRQIVRVTRGSAFLRSSVKVFDEAGARLGGFEQKLLSIGGKFEVMDEHGRALCMLVGKWTSWDFRFETGGRELAHVSKKWAGIGKELFTSADNYVLQIADEVPVDSKLRQLILAAVICIDMVLKE